jgi:HAD superfamily hydrolase (TIGR01484 family)
MRYNTLACDYDSTLATNGSVEETTLSALVRFKTEGGKLLLVTGRELNDLLRIFPQTGLFEMVVAENGGVLYRPETRQARGLSEAPPEALLDLLRKKGVQHLSVGRVIVATVEPYEKAALEAIQELGIEYHIIFNKGAVMLLPSTVNKATGLKAALKELDLQPQQVAGIGDAENDHTFLQACGFSAAVANALPALKEHADLVTHGVAGAGVVELVEGLLSNEKPAGEDRRAEVEMRYGAELPALGQRR